MTIVTQRTVTCDWKNCKNNAGQSAPFVVSFVVEEVESGRVPKPAGVDQFLILINNGIALTFCCPLHASLFFLPIGYEVLAKKVIEFPAPKNPASGPEEGA